MPHRPVVKLLTALTLALSLCAAPTIALAQSDDEGSRNGLLRLLFGDNADDGERDEDDRDRDDDRDDDDHRDDRDDDRDDDDRDDDDDDDDNDDDDGDDDDGDDD